MTVQGPVKKQQPDGMPHGGGGMAIRFVRCWRCPAGAPFTVVLPVPYPDVLPRC